MALVDPAQLDLLKPKKKPKYRNRRCVVDGIKFDSEKEARRWPLLKEFARQGKIQNLRRQVPYRLKVKSVKICRFIADFVYIHNGERVVEDVKSPATKLNRAYRIKVKLMKALYGIVIKEV